MGCNNNDNTTVMTDEDYYTHENFIIMNNGWHKFVYLSFVLCIYVNTLLYVLMRSKQTKINNLEWEKTKRWAVNSTLSLLYTKI